MSKVQQAAGGGRVTVTGLTAGTVRSGVTVTVKQGSKIISSVTGTAAPLPTSMYLPSYGYTLPSRWVGWGNDVYFDSQTALAQSSPALNITPWVTASIQHITANQWDGRFGFTALQFRIQNVSGNVLFSRYVSNGEAFSVDVSGLSGNVFFVLAGWFKKTDPNERGTQLGLSNITVYR